MVPGMNVTTISDFVSLDIWSQIWTRRVVTVPDTNATVHVLNSPAYLYVDLWRV